MERNTKFIFLFWSLLFVFLLVCNIMLPPIGDDFAHAELAKNGFWGALDGFSWNPRIGQFLLIWFIAGLPPILFDLLNACIGTVFIFLVFVLIEGRTPSLKSDYGELLFILVAILMTTMFGSVFLWTSGALNYLWGYTFIAIHWIPYRLFWKNVDYKLGVAAGSALSLLSICAGWASEQVGIISLLIHTILVVYNLARKLRIPIWYWLGIVGFAIGYCILLYFQSHSTRVLDISDHASKAYLSISQLLHLHPGEMVLRLFRTIGYACSVLPFDCLLMAVVIYWISRRAKATGLHLILVLSVYVILKVIIRLVLPANYSQQFYFYFRMIMSIVLLVVAIWQAIKRENIRESLLFIIYFVSLTSVIQIEGHIPPRAQCAQSLLLITIIIFLLQKSIPSIFQAGFLRVLGYGSMLMVIVCLVDFNFKQKELFSKLEEAHKVGQEELVVFSEYFQSPYRNLQDWINPGSDPDSWINKSYSDHFQINRFIVE